MFYVVKIILFVSGESFTCHTMIVAYIVSSSHLLYLYKYCVLYYKSFNLINYSKRCTSL